MIKFRKSMFETNSSSNHSVVISKDWYENYMFDKDDEFIINFDEKYSRDDLRVYMDPISKAAFYLAVYTNDVFWSLPEEVRKDQKNGLSIFLDKLKDEYDKVLRILQDDGFTNTTIDLPKVEWVEKRTSRDGTTWGEYWSLRIDQEGFEDFDQFLEDLKDEGLMKTYLLNANSFVITGGDEYDSCVEGSMLASVLLRGREYKGYHIDSNEKIYVPYNFCGYGVPERP